MVEKYLQQMLKSCFIPQKKKKKKKLQMLDSCYLSYLLLLNALNLNVRYSIVLLEQIQPQSCPN